jgi:hypothetical protein
MFLMRMAQFMLCREVNGLNGHRQRGNVGTTAASDQTCEVQNCCEMHWRAVTRDKSKLPSSYTSFQHIEQNIISVVCVFESEGL